MEELFRLVRDKSDIGKALVEKGVDVNDRLQNGAPPLIYAVCNNVIDIAEYLLEKGAELNTKDKKNKTPLANACKKGGLEIVKYLLEHKADLQVGNTKVSDVVKDKAIRQYLSE